MKDQLKYYNRQYPQVDEVVMIRIDDIGESCVNVTLMEYDIGGIIIFKELWNKRLRKKNLRQAAPIGRTMPAQVMISEESQGAPTGSARMILLPLEHGTLQTEDQPQAADETQSGMTRRARPINPVFHTSIPNHAFLPRTGAHPAQAPHCFQKA